MRAGTWRDDSDEVSRARDALYSLDPECDRDEWVKLAMAAKDAGLDLPTFNAWSATADIYFERDTRDVWKSIKEGGGVGAGTLFREAKLAGWMRLRAEGATWVAA